MDLTKLIEPGTIEQMEIRAEMQELTSWVEKDAADALAAFCLFYGDSKSELEKLIQDGKEILEMVYGKEQIEQYKIHRRIVTSE